jgi:hypothetical protein
MGDLWHGACHGCAVGTSSGERDSSGRRWRQSLLDGEREFIDKVREATPTGRNVTMEDIVDGVDFLMRNESVQRHRLVRRRRLAAAMRVALIGAGRMGSAMGGRVAAPVMILWCSTAPDRALRTWPDEPKRGWPTLHERRRSSPKSASSLSPTIRR